MILLWFIIILMAGGILAWIAGRWDPKLSKWIALIATVANFLLILNVWIRSGREIVVPESAWIERMSVSWIPTFGISFNLALDGLSLLMLLLTFFLGILAVLTSW